MNLLEGIQEKIKCGQYEYSKHALDQSILRNIKVCEVTEALLSTIELIENYPHDYYGSSCLILGFTVEGKPIHIVCSHPTRSIVKLITVYIPDRGTWDNFRTRK